MVFSIIDAMTDGFERTLERNGLVLAAVFVVLALLNAIVAPASLGPTTSGPEPAVGVGAIVTGILSFVITLATVVAAIVALRTFVSDETETIPRELVRENIGLATLNVIVGAIVFALLVAVGSVFFVIPGLFVLVSLYYWIAFVAVEDQNFLAAFRSSWELTGGNRLRLFGLGVAVLVLGFAINLAAALPALVIGGFAGVVLTQFVAALVTVYAIATTARAYDQLVHLRELPGSDPRPGPAGTPA